MIRETIEEQNMFPMDGCDDENIRSTSIQHSFPWDRCNDRRDPENSGRYPVKK